MSAWDYDRMSEGEFQAATKKVGKLTVRISTGEMDMGSMNRRGLRKKEIFYVGQDPSKMTPGWIKGSLEEAVSHAERLLETEPYRKEVRIVRVVAIVKRQRAPIVVEKV